MSLPEEIARRMMAKGLNAKRLSAAARLNESYVRDILRGRSIHPRTDTIAKLAAALGCAVSELTGAASPASLDTGQAQGTESETLRKAQAVARRALALDEDIKDRDDAMAKIAAAVYDVLIDRKRSGRPLRDEEEAFSLMEDLIRRMRREM
jgi:transcriptional regulator with XRE-family HTH domain